MLKHIRPWLWILAAILLGRLISMALYPLVDTTEPRYADIARLMAETGDWITPWFEPGVPFWGKPPLSFWTEAASIRLFGLSELAVRLPSWFATIIMVILTWRYTRELEGIRPARLSALVFSTMALTYMSSGAVMTDPFLALGTTLSLVSFGMVIAGRHRYWRWLFFGGLVIGLLAKGPLALVLIGIPVTLWLIPKGRWKTQLSPFPWLWGSVATVLLSVPWYIAAELKTPGFIDYFIVGEHFRRFLDPGWAGDLYGNAHLEPRGTIWIYWLWASFPWGVLAAGLLIMGLLQRTRRGLMASAIAEPSLQFVLLCALAPMLFFSLAGNVLWTYILPSLPFSALLTARGIQALEGSRALRRAVMPLALIVPVAILAYAVYTRFDSSRLKTEQAMVQRYDALSQPGDSALLYLESVPFSARYYSQEQARDISLQQLQTMRQKHQYTRYFIAVPHKEAQPLLAELPPGASIVFRNARYSLIMLKGETAPGEADARP